MKKILLLLALLPALLFSAEVEVNKKVICNDRETIFKSLSNYGETPLWIGKISETAAIVFVNPTTRSWTVVQTSETIACVIVVGNDFMYKLPPSPEPDL